MNFSILFFSIFILISKVFCSNFRNFSEKKQLSDLKLADNLNNGTSLITLTANLPNNTDTLDGLKARQMDDILVQEKPVLLNTIPHTALNHILFVNSSGLFTNITVVLTYTAPIAVTSPENDSIHRILTNFETSKIQGEINDQILKNMHEIPKEIPSFVNNTAEYIKRQSLILAGVADLKDNSTTNSTVLENDQLQKFNN